MIQLLTGSSPCPLQTGVPSEATKMSQELRCTGLGRRCDFPRWHEPAAQRAGRQLACRALAGERTAAEERELKFPSWLLAGGHCGKRDWEGAPWAHMGWDRAAQAPCLRLGLSQIAEAAGSRAQVWLWGGDPGARQQIGEVPGEAGATLASGREGSPGTHSRGSAQPRCSVPGIWRQPKALLLCVFAAHAEVSLEPKPKSFEDACG